MLISNTRISYDEFAIPGILCDNYQNSEPPSAERSMLVMWSEGSYALNHEFESRALPESSSPELQGSGLVGNYSSLGKSATSKSSGSDCRIGSGFDSDLSTASTAPSSSAASAPSFSSSIKGFDVPSLNLILGNKSSVLLYHMCLAKSISDCE
ncbi:hypothetical protein J1N35_014929 [Gossypium stocksii]|uniref:Uncharacterized protein n=1 Tax=Gossypium stocksii TaxID=47602 RepID=A0A9D3VWA1_9ROSI|nr:hypothetical protein J1N35_014929 [Gossypium stocksii]